MRRVVPAGALLAVMATLLVWEAYSDSLTYDEGKYIRAGYCAITRGVIDLEPTNPAGFKLLAGAGLALFGPAPLSGRARCESGDYRPFYNVGPSTLRRLIFSARLLFVGLSLLLALAVYSWARAMLGFVPGLVALSLIAFEPNLLAHGHLASGDMLATFGTVVCLGAFWRSAYWQAGSTGSRWWLVVSGVGLGLGLLGKVSILFLVPVLLAIQAAGLLFGHGSGLFSWRQTAARGGPVVTVVAVGWAVVCLAYLPFRTQATPFGWPAPLSWIAPSSWIYGVGYQLGHVAAGSTYNYLNGQVRVGHGFWQYFPETFALKTTLGMLVLSAIALVFTWGGRRREAVLFLWLPAAALMLAAILGGIDIGVRYILPIYPLLAVAIAAGTVVFARARRQVAAIALMLVAAAAASLAHAPNHLGYFNELAGATPELYLADSNLDWGQDAWRLRDWWIGSGRPPLQTAYFGPLPLSDYGIASRTVSVRDNPAPGVVVASLTQVTSYGQDETSVFAIMRLCPTDIGRIGTSLQPLIVSSFQASCPMTPVVRS